MKKIFLTFVLICGLTGDSAIKANDFLNITGGSICAVVSPFSKAGGSILRVVSICDFLTLNWPRAIVGAVASEALFQGGDELNKAEKVCKERVSEANKPFAGACMGLSRVSSYGLIALSAYNLLNYGSTHSVENAVTQQPGIVINLWPRSAAVR